MTRRSALAAVVVLAAGEGTRMRSATPKSLHAVAGRSLLGHILAATAPLQAGRTLVVVGHGGDEVTAALKAIDPEATAVPQEQLRGTGHSARVALEAAPDIDGTVLVVYGDMPLLTTETLQRVLAAHADATARATLLSAYLPDPSGYGRILRDDEGRVAGIVEHKDADDAQRHITEVNAGVYAFEAAALREHLTRLGTDNAQGEEYLTDVIAGLVAAADTVIAVVAEDWQETLGVNDRAQLAEAGDVLRRRIIRQHQLAGVTVVDPASTWVDATVTIEPDALIAPYTMLHGGTAIAAGAEIGPWSRLTDTTVGPDARVLAATCVGAEIGPEASVGPYTYLRPGTRLGRGAKAGGFVEIKASAVGDGSKVPHLSYVGDTTIGAGSNVGAGTITCNFDGTAKSTTEIGDNVFVGSGSMLVAPLSLGDGSYVAAGSTITDDVPPGSLGIARARQETKEGWAARRRSQQDEDRAHGDDRGDQQ